MSSPGTAPGGIKIKNNIRHSLACQPVILLKKPVNKDTFLCIKHVLDMIR